MANDEWNTAAAVILVDKLARRNTYEVYVRGRQIGRAWRLDEAKNQAEKALGEPCEWRRARTDEVNALHYYWGWTTEFTDPEIAYFGEPALAALSSASRVQRKG